MTSRFQLLFHASDALVIEFAFCYRNERRSKLMQVSRTNVRFEIKIYYIFPSRERESWSGGQFGIQWLKIRFDSVSLRG